MSKIDRETAEISIEEWKKKWKIGRKLKHSSGEVLQEFEEKIQLIIDLVQDGNLIYDEENNTLEYIFEEETKDNVTSVKIRRPKGDFLMGQDKFAENELMKKSRSILCEMTGKNQNFYASVDFIDYENLMMIVTLFLAA